jgi:ferredoxin-NAD(P)+ reductase (naphthalene dioxygenase ferredoxin-specific)
MRARECRARVSGVRVLAPRILEADLVMEEPPALDFQAGQWVSVPFGPRIVRPYSIASTPLTPERITLCADVAPGGIGSRWFRALAAGDAVVFKGPLGGFVLARDEPRRPLFVAEEIGIVPIRSILAWLDATGFAGPARLVYGARDPSGLAYDAELRDLARRRPAFAYDPVVPTADAAWPGRRGELLDAVAALAVDGGTVAYVAGGGGTVDRVREVLAARGLERKAVRWEKFW